MKKILLLTIFTLLLAGCNSQQTTPSPEKNVDKNTASQQAESEEDKEQSSSQQEKEDKNENTSSQSQEEDTKEVPFESDTATFEDGQLTIHYPQLTDMKDKKLEQQMNNLIKEEATLFLTQYQDSDAPLTLEYEVLLPESDTISILYKGNYNGGMYPTNLFFTTTIDWKKGEKIRFSEVFVVDEAFIGTLKKASYLDWEQPTQPNKEKQDALFEYLDTYTTQDLIEFISKADQPTPEANPYGVYSYYTNNTVVLSIQVPHALGDHAEFEINLEDLVKK